MILFLAPVIQLFIFGYVVSTDVTHVTTAIYDEDNSSTSRELNRSSRQIGILIIHSRSPELEILTGRWIQACAGSHAHPAGLARRSHKATALLQVIIDGTESMTARIINGYNQDIWIYSQEKSRVIASKLMIRPARLKSIEGRLNMV